MNSYERRPDYEGDPFKAMTRHYDALVVGKSGGTSIFAPHRRLGPMTPAREKSEAMDADDFKKWAARPTHKAPTDAARLSADDRRFARSLGHEPTDYAVAERGVKVFSPGGGRGPKPGRLVAGLTGKLGGYIGDEDTLP